jgi:uncharacterized protein (DUF362 family)/Pyruvate/2-oxoacid:ferredoxin oxidoreductase delta subunit
LEVTLPTVHIARCSRYDEETVEAAIRESIAALGGIQQFIKPGQKVILKPNLLRPTAPEAQITTHPTVVKAAVKLVQEAGATPIIVDSPGGPHNRAYLRVLYTTTGMAAVARETGATVNDDLRTTLVSFPGGRLLKKIDMLSVIAEADAIISLPKLKTHGLTTLTGATKNLFGVIPGVTKAGYHSKLRTPRQFSEMLIDVLNSCHPVLTIMDGVIGMEGNGPSNGALRDVGVILTAADGVALDVVAAAIIGIPPLDIPPLVVAQDWGQTTGRVEDIEISGLPLDQARIAPPFALPKTVRGERRGGIITRLIGQWRPTKWLVVNPYANARCTACGACVRACPVRAVTIVNKRAHMDLDKCIRCYCCHELCPHNAIDLKRHWLAEWLVR